MLIIGIRIAKLKARETDFELDARNSLLLTHLDDIEPPKKWIINIGCSNSTFSSHLLTYYIVGSESPRLHIGSYFTEEQVP